MAANKDELEIFRYLTEIGSDINICDTKENTAFRHVTISGSVEIIKILLHRGMYVDLTDAVGSIPLDVSASQVNLEATKTLVERGASLTIVDMYGDSPDFGCKENQIGMLSLLNRNRS